MVYLLNRNFGCVQPYGCGVVLGIPLPPNLCGGKLVLRVLLTNSSSGQQFDGVLWMFCIIGPNPPNSHDEEDGEGAHLSITGASLKSHPPACGLLPGRLLPGRLLRPATRQRCARIALRSRLARVPILWSVKLDLFPSFDDPTKFVSRDRHTTIIGFSLTCLEHRSSSHFGILFTFPCRLSSQCRSWSQ